MRHTALPPVVGESPKVLILGTFPSLASREERRHYGHPRNQFWPIIYGICGHTYAGEDYQTQKQFLRRHHIALWDIIETCETDGSLDTEIQTPTYVDVPAFLEEHPTIRMVCFNGGNAATFTKRALKLSGKQILLPQHTLPSTSPANARSSYSQKLEKWQAIIRPVLK